MKAASRLKAIRDHWDTDHSDLEPAIAYNRTLWTILSTAATEQDSMLPADLKRNIALIAIFIFNRSLDLQIDPKPSDLDALIDINRSIAQGLSVDPAEAA
jgi:flagellar protein FlaF